MSEIETRDPLMTEDVDILFPIDFKRIAETTGIEAYIINGTLFYTVKQFAKLVGRSRIRIRELTSRGNENRVLRHMKIESMLFIYAKELEEYPFSTQGNSGVAYRYKMNQNGRLQADIIS